MSNNIFYWRCFNDHRGYDVEKKNEINSLEEMIKCFEEIDFSNQMFGVFKDGCRPIQEDIIHKYRICCNWKTPENKDYERFLKICWELNIFDRDEVNGIYCSNNKISIWMNEYCYIEVFDQLGYKYSKRYTNAASKKIDPNSLPPLIRTWSIGFFDREKFIYRNPMQSKPFHSTSSDERFIKYLKNIYFLSQDPDGMGIFLSSNILRQQEWSLPNINNRFIYSTIKTSLKNANALMLKLYLSLPLSIFPIVPTIFLAFCFYHDDTLEIGIYLTGNNKIFNDENGQKTSADLAILVAHKIKQIILEFCDAEENIVVNIVNSVPLEFSCFTDSTCEFKVENSRKRLIFI